MSGRRCEECVAGRFALAVGNPDGCSRCFCSGVSGECEEQGGLVRRPVSAAQLTRPPTPSARVANPLAGHRSPWTCLPPSCQWGVSWTCGVSCLEFTSRAATCCWTPGTSTPAGWRARSIGDCPPSLKGSRYVDAERPRVSRSPDGPSVLGSFCPTAAPCRTSSPFMPRTAPGCPTGSPRS